MSDTDNTDNLSVYELAGLALGKLVTEKQAAYGDSFSKSGQIMAILYPGGITADQMTDALTVTRILDKLFRVANDKDAFGESPFGDIAGYGLLGKVRHDGQRKAAFKTGLLDHIKDLMEGFSEEPDRTPDNRATLQARFAQLSQRCAAHLKEWVERNHQALKREVEATQPAPELAPPEFVDLFASPPPKGRPRSEVLEEISTRVSPEGFSFDLDSYCEAYRAQLAEHDRGGVDWGYLGGQFTGGQIGSTACLRGLRGGGDPMLSACTAWDRFAHAFEIMKPADCMPELTSKALKGRIQSLKADMEHGVSLKLLSLYCHARVLHEGQAAFGTVNGRKVRVSPVDAAIQEMCALQDADPNPPHAEMDAEILDSLADIKGPPAASAKQGVLNHAANMKGDALTGSILNSPSPGPLVMSAPAGMTLEEAVALKAQDMKERAEIEAVDRVSREDVEASQARRAAANAWSNNHPDLEWPDDAVRPEVAEPYGDDDPVTNLFEVVEGLATTAIAIKANGERYHRWAKAGESHTRRLNARAEDDAVLKGYLVDHCNFLKWKADKVYMQEAVGDAPSEETLTTWRKAVIVKRVTTGPGHAALKDCQAFYDGAVAAGVLGEAQWGNLMGTSNEKIREALHLKFLKICEGDTRAHAVGSYCALRLVDHEQRHPKGGGD